MTSVTFDQFKGMAPRVDPHMLPDGFGQTAQNVKLVRGILQALKAPSTVISTAAGINTIFRYPVGSTVNWLCWSGDVSVVKNTVPGDTKSTVIWSDPTDGIPKHSRNDKLVFSSNFVKDTTDYFRLGVPAPTAAPAVALSGTAPEVEGVRTYVYAWAYRGKLGAHSTPFSTYVGRNEKVIFTGLDTDPPIATSNWPSAKATAFKKFIFQVDTDNNKYLLIGRVDNETETWEDQGKSIKKYREESFKAAAIDAPTSPTSIVNDDGTSVTGWTLGTGWTHGASDFVHAAGAAGDLTRTVAGLTIGEEYVCYITTAQLTAGAFDIKLDSTALASSLAVNQLQIVHFTATATSHNIVISASSTCDVHVLDLKVEGTEVEATAQGSAALDVDERKYVYCFTYQDASGNLKRTETSAAVSITGVNDGDTVLITGMASSSGLPAGTKGVQKRIFRRDKTSTELWRQVAVQPESQTVYEDRKAKVTLGRALNNWALVASSAPVTPVLTLKTSDDTEIDKESRYYVYTYVTAWGEESAPSPVSSLIEALPWESCTLTTGTSAPTNYANVTLKRFYRTDSTGVFRVIFEQDIALATASIVDDVEELALGDAIITTDWDIPPGDSTSPLKGLCMLPNGVLCGGWGNQVGFSEPGYPYAWPIANQFTLDYDFVGAAVTANGVVIGTTGTPYLCQGSDPASMVPIRIEQRQACLSGTSMVDMGDYTIYASPDGLVAISGMEATLITEDVITRDQWREYVFKADGSVSTLKAYLYERRYILFYNNGVTAAGLLFDPVTKDLTSIELNPTAGFNDLQTDTLYLYFDSSGVGSTTGFAGGVLLPDGRVFFVPYNATTARIYDPALDVLTTPSGTYPGSGAYEGGVLLNDGRVFCVPRFATTARIYDPATNTTTTPSGTYPGGGWLQGGVLLNDGRVYMIPYDGTTARIYDPVTDTLTTPTGVFPGASAFQKGVLMADGRVFCVPAQSTTARIYDPVTDTLTTPGGVYPGGDAYQGGVLLNDGRIFCVPSSVSTARIYNPATDTVTIPAGSYTGGAGTFDGGVLLSDGRVFCSPYGSTTARIYDPAHDTLSTPAVTYPGSFQVATAVLLDSGKLLSIPYVGTTARLYDPATDTLTIPAGISASGAGGIKKWDAGDAMTYTWKSGRKLFDYGVNFAAARVDASAYPVTFSLYADGVLKHTQTVSNNRAFRLPSGYRAFDVEVQMSGTNDIRHAILATTIEELKQ